MDKFWWWAGAVIFGWLTYKFATQGAAYMGGENSKAIAFTAVLAAVCLWGATSKSSA